MNFNEISNKIMNGEKIYNIPLRVCFYARVSSESDVQLNSLENQLSYYENYIKSKSNWTFVDGYIEEGVSGVRVDKRSSFKRMIKDAELNKFDLIVTKEVSRFARDLEDSIHYIRKLKNSNVGVFFENQNLNTFDLNSELILNIMFNLAQEESKKLSQRVKFGHRQAIAKSHVLGSSNITGYKKDNCKLVIEPKEALFIRKLFELYSTGEYGFHKLSKILGELGYLNKKGKLYDKDTLKRMIENPKYKGYYRSGVYEVIDYRTKKRKINSKENQIIKPIDNTIIPPIVSEELWNRANEILNSRTLKYKNNNYWVGGVKYSLSSKIYCKDCNRNYQHSHGSKKRNRPIWACGMYLQYRAKECLSPIIAEIDLKNILKNVMKKILPDKNLVITNLLKLYKSEDVKNEYDKELEVIDNYINKIELKKSKILDLVLEGIITKENLKNQFTEYESKINKLNIQRKDVLNKKEILNTSKEDATKMTALIENEIESGSLDSFIRKFVDEIIVNKIDNNRYSVNLDIYINLTGLEKKKKRGASHINGPSDTDIFFITNEHADTIEIKRMIDTPNSFTYNVYIETF